MVLRCGKLRKGWLDGWGGVKLESADPSGLIMRKQQRLKNGLGLGKL